MVVEAINDSMKVSYLDAARHSLQAATAPKTAGASSSMQGGGQATLHHFFQPTSVSHQEE